jgi:hypothetical protein
LKRRSHSRTVSSPSPSAAAIVGGLWCWLDRSMIWARWTSRSGALRARANCSIFRRSSSLNGRTYSVMLHLLLRQGVQDLDLS